MHCNITERSLNFQIIGQWDLHAKGACIPSNDGCHSSLTLGVNAHANTQHCTPLRSAQPDVEMRYILHRKGRPGSEVEKFWESVGKGVMGSTSPTKEGWSCQTRQLRALATLPEELSIVSTPTSCGSQPPLIPFSVSPLHIHQANTHTHISKSCRVEGTPRCRAARATLAMGRVYGRRCSV